MNGYTEIVISDHKIGLKYGLPAIRQIAEKMQKFSLITGDSYNELGIAHIIYAGYCNECVIKDIVPTLSFNIFYEFVENAITDGDLKEKIEDTIRTFEDSRFLKSAVDKKNGEATEEEKKSLLTA